MGCRRAPTPNPPGPSSFRVPQIHERLPLYVLDVRVRSVLASMAALGVMASCVAPDAPGPTPSTPSIPATSGSLSPIDHTRPGFPETKSGFVPPEGTPPDYLAYDNVDFWVKQTSLHGTVVTLAVHRSLEEEPRIGPYEIADREDVAAYVHATFDDHWHLVGGFPYQNATWVVRAIDDPCTWRGATAGGGRVCHGEYANDPNDQGPPSPFTKGFYREWFGHELLHHWLGPVLVAPTSPDGDIFVSETWFVEGLPVYFSARQAARDGDVEAYERILGRYVGIYESYVGGEADRNFSDLAHRIGAGGPSGPNEEVATYTQMLYAKGALVAYRLDEVLAEVGVDWGDVLQELYKTNGLDGTRITNGRLQAVAETTSGLDLDVFFRDFVHSTVRLDTRFHYIEYGPN